MVATRSRKRTLSATSQNTQPTKKKRRNPKVRQNLIETRNHIIENRSALVANTNNEFKSTIDKMDKTAKEVTNASDATLLTEQTDMMSSILQEQTRKCDANTAKVSISELIEAIKDDWMASEGDVPDLNKLFELVHPNYNGVPPLFCFSSVGGLEFKAKPKKKRTVKKKPEIIEHELLKKATEKDEETANGSTDTTNRVQQLIDVLQGKQEDSGQVYRLLETLTNPESFSESLENIYDFAHVASQGIVKILMASGHPVYQLLLNTVSMSES